MYANIWILPCTAYQRQYVEEDAPSCNESRNISIDIEEFRKEVPGIHLRTTLMVGHPGETEEDFEELKEFVEKCVSTVWELLLIRKKKVRMLLQEYEDSIPQEVKQQRWMN